MKAKEVMTTRPEYMDADVSIRDVAKNMRDIDSGFEPLVKNDKVVGVVTDRDIVVRGIAEGVDPAEKAMDIASDKPLYTFEDEDLSAVLKNMQQQKVQRLLVLNNDTDKDLVGIITIGDIADHCQQDENLAQELVASARHYA
ncbi:CBS domain-containing protein [Halomonas urmiana]|uniref:CBS domain-containing protein n=1 Tax=Halomonas urmiana TaxID=490901 RepID=A0A5R8M5E8_9GAMM|nr:CBS domain-containing protein [Halomonas urmiana]TLF44786.1 CBS domain-containing protein [Halomonas urmiana]